jgi:hypothetical protein
MLARKDLTRAVKAKAILVGGEQYHKYSRVYTNGSYWMKYASNTVNNKPVKRYLNRGAQIVQNLEATLKL